MTVNPDEGMQLLTQRIVASRHIAEVAAAPFERETDIGQNGDSSTGAAASAAGPGFELGAVVGLMTRATSALEHATAAMRGGQRFTEWSHIHPIEIPPGPQVSRPVPAGSPAGTTAFYEEPDLWGPNDGYVWRINGWSFVLGAGATSFSIWYDSPGDPTNLILTQTVSGRWEPDRFILMPGRNVVFTSSGGPLLVCKGIAEEMTVGFLPHYLAGSVARYS